MSNKKSNNLPRGWDQAKVRRVLSHYENQSEEGALREDEASFARPSLAVMRVPQRLVPAVRKLIASRTPAVRKPQKKKAS